MHRTASATAALEEMIEQEKLPADLAQSIVCQFDQVGLGCCPSSLHANSPNPALVWIMLAG